MYNNGDAAEQVFRMALNGVEVAAKISGKGAVKLMAYLTAVMKDQKKTKGKSRLTAMLKSGRPLDVFSIRKEDLKSFVSEAKKYGILYCSINSKLGADGMSDIMVRREDSARINHIVERLNYGATDMASIETEIQKSKDIGTPDIGVQEKSAEDKLLDEILDQPKQKEPQPAQNPSQALTGKSRPSEPSSVKTEPTVRDNKEAGRDRSERPSVRQELNDIKTEKKVQENSSPSPVQKSTRHKQPKQNKKSKSKEK
ncbi:MAG: PcfB family protein [Eubacteriales bacterium]|nr:PcfB family protein [Eubacteriales bacterium]